jgi:TetR/AcrR family transcriptional repressor of nem operon
MSKTEATSEMPDTKRRLLEAAMSLMLRQGFTATTVDQICAEADLTKGSFFHYFKTKDEIGEGALDYFYSRQQQQFAEAEFVRLADPLEKIHGLLDFLIKSMKGPQMQSCLCGNLAQELAHTNPRFRASCDEKFSGFAKFIQTTLREAKVKHKANVDFNPESVSLMFVSLMQGSILLAKTMQDGKLIAHNLEHFRSYVDTLFGKTRK